MRLYQFWHADPPADVLGFMDAARDAVIAAGFDYVRLDARSGRDLVAAHHGARGLAVWDACVLPVMLSDYLRLVLMHASGGIYADATYRFDGDLAAFVASAPHAQMPLWMAIVNSNYLMFREPGNRFLRACLELLIDNVEQRRATSSLMAVGPGVLNAVRRIVAPDDRAGIDLIAQETGDWERWGWGPVCAAAERLIEPTPALIADYRSITLVPTEILHRHAAMHLEASHRNGDDYWFRWRGPVYRDAGD